MASIRLIVGLGNPGSEYAQTRHNAGFGFVDALVDKFGGRFSAESKLFGDACRVAMCGQQVWLLKPSTFMNRSGQSVNAALRYFKIPPEEMLVAHDELDLAAGVVRLKFDGGHGGQNGLRDIMAHLGHGRFHRLRVGIGHPGAKDKVTPWVLGRPSNDDGIAIARSFDEVIDLMPLMLDGAFNEAMKRLHTAK